MEQIRFKVDKHKFYDISNMQESLEEVQSIVLCCFAIILPFACSFLLNLLFLWLSVDAWGGLGGCFPFILDQKLTCTVIVWLLLLSLLGFSASFWEAEHALIRRLGLFASILSLLLVECVWFSALLKSGRVWNKAVSVWLFVGVECGFSIAAFVR